MYRINTMMIGLLLITSSASALSAERFDFSWNDINTRDVLHWKGDTAVVRQGSSMQKLSCRITLDSRDIDIAIDRFGIPRTWTSISYTSQKDLEEKRRNLHDKASLHGIKMMDTGNQFVIDYAWVINESTRELRDAAKIIRSTARRSGYRSKRELVGAFASFVQSLEYRIPPDNRINDEGEEILTVGAMMPLETLSKQWGDCDSKSLLFAALVRSIDLIDVTFIVMEDHLFAAVQLVPFKNDHKIRHKASEWVLVELTDAWPIGRVPEKHIGSIKDGDYTVVDLD